MWLGGRMRKELIIVALSLVVLSVVSIPSINAGGEVYVILNKTQYEPDEKGTISITVRNTGTAPLSIKNVTVKFTNWMAYTEKGWDPLGNQTIIYESAVIVEEKKAKALPDITFTVPKDSRATNTNVEIWIYTNEPTPIPAMTYIHVVDPSTQNSLNAMNSIVTLLTVGVILLVISAIIVAAAVIVAGRGRKAVSTA
jgi:hypothetical protein